MPSYAPSFNPFRVLQQHGNFRLFWAGQTVSLIGTWMQSVAQGWLALELTDDAFMVGLVSAAGSFPVLVLSLYGGVLADRHDKLRLVRIAQALLLVQATLLWWVVWSGNVTIGWLLSLALLGGTINAFDIPARQSLVIDLVGRDDLLDAIALNSSGFNLARIIGPGIAAVVIARVGLAACFGLNALSYLAVLAGLWRIDLPRRERLAAPSPLEGLRQGVAYLVGTPEVATVMRLVAVYSVFGVPYLVLMPVIARDELRSDATGYSLLLTCVGVGAVAAALALAALGRRVRQGKLLAAAAYAFSGLLVAFSMSRMLWLSAVILVAVGAAMILNNAVSNSLLQTLAPDALRGRVMSAYAWVFVGLGPVGSILAGTLATLIGAARAVSVGAMIMLLYALWAFARRPEIRRL
jgi:MFS family permease